MNQQAEQERERLVQEHNRLMDDYDERPPHGGWAVCNCRLAVQIRQLTAAIPGFIHYGKRYWPAG